jgi:cysteine desulfurase
MIYLDYNATTPVCSAAIKQYSKTAKQLGNPSSFHQFGRISKEYLENARETIATCISAEPENILFTGSATEANNQVLNSFLSITDRVIAPVHIIISAIEHSSIRVHCDRLSKLGIDISIVPVNEDGIIDLKALEATITPQTKLISVMLANNETGTIQPLVDIVAIAKKHGVLVHTDAVQAIGKTPVSVNKLDIDFLSFSGHKVYGPKGAGALYAKDDASLKSLIHGGGHERLLRAGTENVEGISAFGAAIDWVGKQDISHLKTVADYFWTRLEATIPNVFLNGSLAHKIPGTLNISFEGLNAEALAINLDLEDVAVSTGSACSTGSIEPSPILIAMGLSKERVKSAIRFSLGYPTTTAELDIVLDKLPKLVKKLRNV